MSCLLYTSANLIERIGDAGKRLHTGRSRNDQVALDMKLYCRDEIDELDELVRKLLEELLAIIEANTDTFMPVSYTHLDVYKRQDYDNRSCLRADYFSAFGNNASGWCADCSCSGCVLDWSNSSSS